MIVEIESKLLQKEKGIVVATAVIPEAQDSRESTLV